MPSIFERAHPPRSASEVLEELRKAEARRQVLSRISWLPDIFRIKGSTLPFVAGPVLTMTLIATAVAVASMVYGKNLGLTNSVVPLLSVVVGLLLVFRNGTSYDRYYEGRRDFGQLMSNVRNLARLTWIQVVPKSEQAHPARLLPISFGGGHEGPAPANEETEKARALREDKARALRLMVGFVYATIHHLRGEPEADLEDYDGLLPDEMRLGGTGYDVNGNSNRRDYGSMDDTSSGGASGTSTPRQSTTSSRSTMTPARERKPLLVTTHQAISIKFFPHAPTMPLPLLITFELTRIFTKWKREGCLDALGPAGFNQLQTLIGGLNDQLQNLERIARTPIPIVYGIHLKQCVSFYLFALPFTLVGDLGWKMIPFVTLISFTLMGIEGISSEIENPFGHDENDLPLDLFAAEIKHELEYYIQELPDN